MTDTGAVEGEIVSQPNPVKLTKHDEIIVQLLETAMRNGFNITEACQYAGISRTTFYEWMADDDVFSYRMSVAQTALGRKAKENVTVAIQAGDPNVSLRYLTLRDPDFKPKAEVTTDPEEASTREKLKEFLDDNTDLNDTSSEPAASDTSEAGGEMAQTPTDIS